MLPFFDNLELEQLQTELPNYIAACEDVDPSHDILTFWKNRARSLPHWSTAASKVAVVQQQRGYFRFSSDLLVTLSMGVSRT